MKYSRSVEALQAFVLDLLHHYGLGGLFVAMAIGNVGIPVGTELIVPVAGAAAGAGHLPPWPLVGLVATLGELVGGFILYLVGWYAGEPVVRRFGKRGEHELARIHGFYGRWGKPAVFICRFIPVIRGIAALPAGISRMEKRYFVTYTLLGSSIFCFGLAYLGNVMGRHVDTLMPILHKFSLLIVVVLVAAIVLAVLARRSATARRARTGPAQAR